MPHQPGHPLEPLPREALNPPPKVEVERRTRTSGRRSSADIEAEQQRLRDEPFSDFEDAPPLEGGFGLAASLGRRQAAARARATDLDADLALTRNLEFAQSELERARGLGDLQSQRFQETSELANRRASENERVENARLEANLAASGLGDSRAGDARRAAQQEAQAGRRADITSALSISELNAAVQIEQQAVDRLWQTGQTEAAFAQEVRIITLQFRQMMELERFKQDQANASGIGGFFGDLAFGLLF